MAVDDVLLYAFMLQNVWKETKYAAYRAAVSQNPKSADS